VRIGEQMRGLMMRGGDERKDGLFSYVSCEARVPQNHPLRPIRAIVDEALEILSPAFEQLYAPIGRPSIPPEKLLRAPLLQLFYSVNAAVSPNPAADASHQPPSSSNRDGNAGGPDPISAPC
jgi:hypothetical protein